MPRSVQVNCCPFYQPRRERAVRDATPMAIRHATSYSSRNFVSTFDVVSTSSRELWTYFTMVGMCPFVSFSLFCIMPLMGSTPS